MDGSKRTVGSVRRRWVLMTLSAGGLAMLLALVGIVGVAIGQEATTPPPNASSSAPAAAAPPEPDGSAASEPAPAAQPAAAPTAEEVRSRLLERRAESPAIEPVRREGDPAALVGREKVGVAPGLGVTALKREGSFVVSRRGRMVPAVGSAAGSSPGWMFAFESDDTSSADAPMILMPCRLLEDMEQMAERLGDSAVMLVSGEVYVYRGANYLLPTVMRLAADRENLQP